MQTTRNNDESTAVIIQPTGNLASQQILHVKTFKILGGVQLGGILVILCLIELMKNSFLMVYKIPISLCSGWFVVAGCLPMCMSKNIESSLKCQIVVFMSPSQPEINLNAPGNQIENTSIKPGKEVLHSKAQQYNFVGGTDQGVDYHQNIHFSYTYPPQYTK